MTIKHSSLHSVENFNQVQRVLVHLQLQINQNAQTHRAMALAGSIPLNNYMQVDNNGVKRELPGLLTMILDCIQTYRDRLKLFSKWKDRPDFVNHINKIQIPISEFTQLHDEIKSGLDTFASKSLKEYSDIIKACSQLIEDVNAPDFFIPHDKSIAEAVK